MPRTVAPRFFNRELSWLEFNQRVLDQALDPRTPLLERVKFFCICSSNLDEFFEVRVAGVKQEMESGSDLPGPDGLTPGETFRAITERVNKLVDDQYRCWREELRPALAAQQISFLKISDLGPEDRRFVEAFYNNEVHPVLTPLANDPAHPFPHIANKSLNLMVQLAQEKGGRTLRHLSVVRVPRALPRLLKLPRPDARQDFLFLADIISYHLGEIFPGMRILGCWPFRVTRNSELYLDEEETANLLKAVENQLHKRRKGDAVRLELDKDCPASIRDKLLSHLRLTPNDLYLLDGPINPTRLMAVCEGKHSPELRDPPFTPVVSPQVQGQRDLFALLRERDVLLHHPYESFGTVVDFLEAAAADPKVLAIKQTLYRTGGDARINGALMTAAKKGKEVTVVNELRARFDEEKNIEWTSRLEDAGVHVVYGLVGHKIHSKICLVVRKEGDSIRRYVHLGTGNYNPSTAKLYTDLSLLTARQEIAEDATNLFNLLTGICEFPGTKALLVAPFQLHGRIVELIQREAAHAGNGIPARIIAKMNSLVDPEVIKALYGAAQAGVKIELIVRGICCLVPGVKGLSENITVRSIVDRFLEHGRIFYFENGCQPEVFVGSADWMPRNFFRRIEVVFPVEDGRLRDRVVGEILDLQLRDTVKARFLQANGSYRAHPDASLPRVRCQEEFMTLAKGKKAGAGSRPAAGPKLALRAKPVDA